MTTDEGGPYNPEVALSAHDGNQPRVSVVMPVRDVARYVLEAIHSVIAQSFPSWELIVVDDGSRDGTAQRVGAMQDRRVRLLRLKGEGAPEARNRGLRECRGSVLAFLDGDDLWEPDKLERHLAVLDAHAGVDLTFSHCLVIDDRGRPVPGVTQRGAGVLSREDLLIENLIRTCSAVVMRRAALQRVGKFDPMLEICSDYEMWLRVAALRPDNVYGIPQPLTRYRSRPGQLTRQGARIQSEWNRVLGKASLPAGREGERIARRARVNLRRYLAYLAYRDGRAGTALGHLARGLRVSPGDFLRDPRNWAAVVASLGKGVLPGRLVASAEDAFVRLGSRRNRRARSRS